MAPDRQSSTPLYKQLYEAIRQETNIPQICGRYGLDWGSLVDERRWPLLDRPAPRPCADCIDYGLRDAMSPQLASAVEINELVQHFVVGTPKARNPGHDAPAF